MTTTTARLAAALRACEPYANAEFQETADPDAMRASDEARHALAEYDAQRARNRAGYTSVPADADGLEITGMAGGEAVAMGEPAESYAVHWHMCAGGADLAEEFATHGEALAFAYAIGQRTGLTVRDFS